MFKYLLILLLVGCTSTTNLDSYETTSRDIYQTANIHVTWLSEQETQQFCSSIVKSKIKHTTYFGCVRSHPKDSDICQIFLPRPNDFNDAIRIYTLGHETWHCFGATHK